MTNPMLAELDEVVRLIAKEEKEEAGKPLSILRDNEELDNACYWFMKNHHATLADMAKRLEAAERKCGACPNSEQAAAAYREYMSLNDDDADKAKQDLGTLVMGWHAAMTIDATQEGEG